MEENINFQQGSGLLNYKVYEQAISLFQNDLNENPLNLASYQNIGLAQTHLGVIKKDSELLKTAIENLEKAISISKELNYDNGYPIAETNLNWAKEELNKLT